MVALGDNNNETINHYDNYQETYQKPHFMSQQGKFINSALNPNMQNLTLKQAFFYVCEEAIYRLIHDDESQPKQKMFTFLSQLQGNAVQKNFLSENFLKIDNHGRPQEVRRKKIQFDDNAMAKAIKQFIDTPNAHPGFIVSHLLSFFRDSDPPLRFSRRANPQLQFRRAKNCYPAIYEGIVESFAKPIAQYLHSVVRAHTADSWKSIQRRNDQLVVRFNNDFTINNFDQYETVGWRRGESLRSYLLSKVPAQDQTFASNQLDDTERQVIESTLQQYASFDKNLRHKASCEIGTKGRIQELISGLRLMDAPAVGGQLDCGGNVVE